MIREQSVLCPCPHILCASVGDEAVLYDEQNGTYFGLNTVAARLWELAGTRMTVSQMLDVLVGEFDVDRAVLDADLRALVPRMVGQGLWVVDSPGPGGASG